MPKGWDSPAAQDPAQARPGGRGGRDVELGAPEAPSGQDPALSRPGGRGGRDVDFSPSEVGTSAPISLDRPGGRGGRDIGGGGGGDDGGSGGGKDDSSGGGDGDDTFFGPGQILSGMVVYVGVLAAAWQAHKAFFAKKAEAVKSCCAGKAKADQAADKVDGKKKKK
eukprot:gene11936-12079_t